MLGLGLAVLPARAQEAANAEPMGIEAMVEAGQAVLLPLGDAFGTPETVADMDADAAAPEADGDVEATVDDSDVVDVDAADADLSDDQAHDGATDAVAVDEPEVEVVEEETTELLEAEVVPEPEAVTEVVPVEDIVDESTEELAAVEESETPEPASLIDDEVDEQALGIDDPPADLEPEVEMAAVDDAPVVEETLGEGSADVGDVEEIVSEEIVVEETVVDDVIVDPETGEPAAEAIIVEETVIEEVTTVEPTIEEPTIEEPAIEEAAAEEPAIEETVVEVPPVEEVADIEPSAGEPALETTEVVVDEPAPEDTVAALVENDQLPAEPTASVVEPAPEEPAPEEIVVAETVVEAPEVEEPAGDQAEALVGAMVPLRTAELGNAESIGPYRLWLASYKTVREAKEGWQQIALANQDLLADLTPIIVLKDLGQDEGTFFRLQAGPLQSQSGASARCTALVDRNVYCSVLGP